MSLNHNDLDYCMFISVLNSNINVLILCDNKLMSKPFWNKFKNFHNYLRISNIFLRLSLMLKIQLNLAINPKKVPTSYNLKI